MDNGCAPLLSLLKLTKTFGRTRAVDELSFSIGRGELFGLLGPSGCGKTTTLRLLLGLEKPDAGTVEFQGRDITAVPPEARGFGMVFQNYALFTNMSVHQNIAFGLTAAANERRERVESLLALVRLPAGYASRRPDQLSAGEQQRVAIARALAIQPPILLLDEPLANLDMGLRRSTGEEIRALVKRLGLAAIYVTHDQTEAFGLCDRIAVMRDGHIRQTGTPLDVYEHPSELFVAQFLGFNTLPATPATGGVQVAGGRWTLKVCCADMPAAASGELAVAIRPEDIQFREAAARGANVLPARVRRVVFEGPTCRILLDVGGVALQAIDMRGTGLAAGDDCTVEIAPDRPLLFPAAAADR